ncbi:MAG: hypothetical protein WCV99_17815 [Sterolibacterium sp.]|jgi:hypothetical protein
MAINEWWAGDLVERFSLEIADFLDIEKYALGSCEGRSMHSTSPGLFPFILK